MKATSVRARSSRRVAVTALVGLSAVTLLTGCGFETRQQGAAVVNGQVIHEDEVEETARQLREAQFDFPENIVVTALVASPLLHDAVRESGSWQPDATYANAIAAIPDATETTKEFVSAVALIQSAQMTDDDVARYRANLDKAAITVNPRYGDLIRSEEGPVFFTIGQKRPNWISTPIE
ncbi:hypothetical protein [Intrasporangium sp.]|uniref:hypothetical protein n=1 Tax=Intrasporangium sp. TaxID=1925024 RepID=UPI002939904F|nr:hypothetical protein [Intrasporangium sp.]MDV3222370.1 hypothetical protein [Intrasporangium sp.]